MILSEEEIRMILNLLACKVVIEPSDTFPYYITTRPRTGYSDDPKVGGLQAKLSIMLQVVTEAKR